MRSWWKADSVNLMSMPRLALAVATLGGAGTVRPAPGTWGSIVAAALALIVILVIPAAWVGGVMLAMAVAATLAGVLATPAAQDRYGALDPGQVVIDEAAGLWLALAVIPGAWVADRPLLAVLAALVAFRIFDIAKPWPIPVIERLGGVWGVMLDDLLAGLLAGAVCAPLLA